MEREVVELIGHVLVFAGLLIALVSLLRRLSQPIKGYQPTEADLSWPRQGADASSPRIGLYGYLVRCRRSMVRAGVGDARRHYEAIRDIERRMP